jgi:hypothetical protein
MHALHSRAHDARLKRSPDRFHLRQFGHVEAW